MRMSCRVELVGHPSHFKVILRRKQGQRVVFRSGYPETHLAATIMSEEPETTVKRRRIQQTPSPQYRIDNDDNYEPYIPVAQRRQAKLAKLSALGSSTGRDDVREARKAEEEQEDEEQEEERRREKVRRGRALLVEAQEVHSKKASEGARL